VENFAPDALHDPPGTIYPETSPAIGPEAALDAKPDSPPATGPEAAPDAKPDSPPAIGPEAAPDAVPDSPPTVGADADASLKQDLPDSIDEAGPEASGSALGLVGFRTTPGGTPVSMRVGSNLYIGEWDTDPSEDETGSIQEYDIGDLASPALVFQQDTPGEEVHQLVLDGGRIFVANDVLGLSVFESTAPPSYALQCRLSNGSYAHTLAIAFPPGDAGREFALVGYLYSGGLGIYDLADSVDYKCKYESASIRGIQQVMGVVAQGSHAYVLFTEGVTGESYLEVLDLTPLPRPPNLLGALPLRRKDFGDAGTIRLLDKFIVFATVDYVEAKSVIHSGGLRFIDISDPTRPTLAGSVDLSVPRLEVPSWVGPGVDLSSDRACVATADGLQVIDVSNPRSPAWLTSYSWPASFGRCYGSAVAMRDGIAFVGCYHEPGGTPQGGLAVYRVW
jgi:hypothetical protein